MSDSLQLHGLFVARQAPLSIVILQAIILEWVAIPFSRRSAQPRDQNCISHVSCIGRQALYYQCHFGSPIYLYISQCIYICVCVCVYICIHIYVVCTYKQYILGLGYFFSLNLQSSLFSGNPFHLCLIIVRRVQFFYLFTHTINNKLYNYCHMVLLFRLALLFTFLVRVVFCVTLLLR